MEKKLTSDAATLPGEELRKIEGGLTGQVLIDAFRNSPHPEIDLAPERFAMPVRNVEL
jgi:hypothetical protein